MTPKLIINMLRALSLQQDHEYSKDLLEKLHNMGFADRLWAGTKWTYNISHRGILYLKSINMDPPGSIM